MAPNATLAAFWEAIGRGDAHDAWERKRTLIDWVLLGGFKPTDRDSYRRMLALDPDPVAHDDRDES